MITAISTSESSFCSKNLSPPIFSAQRKPFRCHSIYRTRLFICNNFFFFQKKQKNFIDLVDQLFHRSIVAKEVGESRAIFRRLKFSRERKKKKEINAMKQHQRSCFILGSDRPHWGKSDISNIHPPPFPPSFGRFIIILPSLFSLSFRT